MPPRIDDEYLECSVFLYPDDSSARKGDQIGGSGFIVSRPFESSDDDLSLAWVATNCHVIERGAWTIRVNTVSGDFDTIDTAERDWFYHPDGYDLAVCPFFHRTHHKVSHVPVSQFLTEEILRDYAIGPGDSAFVVGRFVNHEGRQRNTPTVRYGQIAQMPIEKVVCEGQEQESFLVEIRSIGGFSGSPVFVFLDPVFYRPIDTGKTHDGRPKARGVFDKGPWLLGVDWCMLPDWRPVCDSNKQEISNGWMVPNNTGMMGVVPAWNLSWLLMEHDPVVQRSRELERRVLEQKAAEARRPTAISTSATPEPPAKDGNPRHKEDFNRLLGEAAKGHKSGD